MFRPVTRASSPERRAVAAGCRSPAMFCPLSGIAFEVVQLLARRFDVAIAIVGQRQQLAPPEVVARIEGFRVDALRRQAPAIEQGD